MIDSTLEYLSDLGADPERPFPEPVVEVDRALRARTWRLLLALSVALVGFGVRLLWGVR